MPTYKVPTPVNRKSPQESDPTSGDWTRKKPGGRNPDISLAKKTKGGQGGGRTKAGIKKGKKD